MIKTFKNLEEMESYYNYKTDTYEFIENGNLIDIVIDFELDINSNIRAGNIKAMNIKAMDITAWDIQAEDIRAEDITAYDIKALYIQALDIKALDIKAVNICAENINANNILYYSVCYASSNFVCNSIKGTRPNSKHFCLDSDVVIRNKK